MTYQVPRRWEGGRVFTHTIIYFLLKTPLGSGVPRLDHFELLLMGLLSPIKFTLPTAARLNSPNHGSDLSYLLGGTG